MNKLTTVYIRTKIEDEIPEIEGYYKTEEEETSYLSSTGNWFDNYRLEKPRYPIHWLKPTEGYFFTPEELKQVLSDAFDVGERYKTFIVENWDDNGKGDQVNISKEQYIENFLNK